jgi:hypothetical protein
VSTIILQLDPSEPKLWVAQQVQPPQTPHQAGVKVLGDNLDRDGVGIGIGMTALIFLGVIMWAIVQMSKNLDPAKIALKISDHIRETQDKLQQISSTTSGSDRKIVLRDYRRSMLKPICCLVFLQLLAPLPVQAADLKLTPTNRSNTLGNPIYSLKGYVNGVKKLQVDVVTGTAKTQKRDRHIGGNFAPLPDGKYKVEQPERRKMKAIGGTFIHLKPAFRTKRTELGIHWNPGFNQPGKQDGTAGCIGLTRKIDRDVVNKFVRKYKVRRMVVKIVKS